MSSLPPYPAPSPDHQDRRGLAPPAVAAGRVARGQRREQPTGEGHVGVGAQPRGLHGEHDLLAGQDVALDRVAVAGDAAGPVEAGVSGVRGRAAVQVDDAELAVVAALVVLDQPLERDRGVRAVVEVGESLALVGDVRLGLGRDRPDPGDRRRHRGAHREELGCHRHPPRLAVVGPGHDRERHVCTFAGREARGVSVSRPDSGPASLPGPLSVCGEVHWRSDDGRVLQRLGFPSVGPHRRFVTAIAVDALGSGVFMPLSMLYFLAATPLSLLQVGLAISVASAIALPAGPLVGSLVDRLGAKHVLLAGNLLQAVGFFAVPGRRLVRGRVVLDHRGDPRPHRLLGLLRQHRHRHLAAGGAGAVVRLPRRAAQRRLRGGRARLGGGHLDRHRPGVRARGRHQRGVVRLRPVAAAGGARSASRRHPHQPAGLLGDGAGRRPLPAAGRCAGRLLAADDDPQLRAAGVRRHRARPARLGHRRGVHRELPDGRLRPGAGRQPAHRARALPDPPGDPGGLRRVVRRVPRRQRALGVDGDGGDRPRRDRLHPRRAHRRPGAGGHRGGGGPRSPARPLPVDDPAGLEPQQRHRPGAVRLAAGTRTGADLAGDAGARGRVRAADGAARHRAARGRGAGHQPRAAPLPTG